MNDNERACPQSPICLSVCILCIQFFIFLGCGTQPSSFSRTDQDGGDTSDANWSDIERVDADTFSDSDSLLPDLGDAGSDALVEDSRDADDATDPEIYMDTSDLDSDAHNEADAASCLFIDPCGRCADGTFPPVGQLGDPCGPCAASQLTCRDGLTVCDMSACACQNEFNCSGAETCTAGVCAPDGWAYVAPAEYIKGCNEAYSCAAGQSERRSPLRVTISRGLLVRTTEETEESWQQIMGERTVHTDAAPALPAVLFTFDEVATYLNLRSQEAGLQSCYELVENETDYLDEWPLMQACEGWRLPTEAEWECFTRAGTDSRTWLGNPAISDFFDFGRDPIVDRIAYYFAHIAPLVDLSVLADCGNVLGDEPDAIADLLANFPACRPISVGRLEANPWGLHDVLGNVLELVWDREGFNTDFAHELDPVRTTSTSATDWQLRRSRHAFGGFYGYNAAGMQYLMLEYHRADRPNLHVGFRAVRSLPGVRLGRTVEPR